MIKMTLRSLWARKIRFALTGLAVVLGVAFVAGTFVLTDTVRHSFDSLFDTANSGIDVVVQDADATGSDTATGQRVDASLVEQISGIDGVAAAFGSVKGYAEVVGSDGKVHTLDSPVATLGTNWIADDELNPYDLASGRAPITEDEVVLDVATVEREGWSLGDTVTVLGRGEPARLTLVGTARYGSVDGILGSSLVAVTDDAAQEMFAEPGKYDAIVVRADDGVEPAALSARVATVIDDDSIDVLTGAEDTAAQKDTLHENLAFFDTFLMTFAWIALFVGTFIIRNTFSIVVAQRQKEAAMLRAIGASRRQLLRSILLEASLVGATASAIGLAAGLAVAKGLTAMLAAAGLEAPDGGTVVQTRTIVVSFVIGIAVTVLSAVGPAIRGSRVKPIAALRDGAVDRADSSGRRTVAGLTVLGLGTALFVAGVVNPDGAAAAIGLGALIATIGVTILGPVIVRPVVRVLGAAYPRMYGTVGRIARENSRRNPRRTAATASALMIGVALVTVITVLASSGKASVAATVDRTMRADYVVDSGAWVRGGFSPVLADQLADLPEVEAVSPIRSTEVTIDGHTQHVQGVDTEALAEVLDLDVVAGSMTDVHGEQIAVEADEAEANGWELGDTVTLDFVKTGSRQFTIGAIYDELLLNVEGGNYLVGLDTFETNVTDQYDLRIYVATDPSVSAEDAQAAIAAATAGWPNADVQDQAAVKAAVAEDIDKVLGLVYGMLALAVIIALIGIANTLGLSIHERRREIGVLRAVGMERAQVRRAVRLESVLVALLGTALGLGVALAGSWGVVRALASQGFSEFAVPVVPIVTIVVVAVVAGVLAAVGPARRAARLDVLGAIASA